MLGRWASRHIWGAIPALQAWLLLKRAFGGCNWNRTTLVYPASDNAASRVVICFAACKGDKATSGDRDEASMHPRMVHGDASRCKSAGRLRAGSLLCDLLPRAV